MTPREASDAMADGIECFTESAVLSQALPLPYLQHLRKVHADYHATCEAADKAKAQPRELVTECAGCGSAFADAQWDVWKERKHTGWHDGPLCPECVLTLTEKPEPTPTPKTWQKYAVADSELGPVCDSADEAKDAYLSECLGWRYKYERDQQEVWQRFLDSGGRLVRVTVTEIIT